MYSCICCTHPVLLSFSERYRHITQHCALWTPLSCMTQRKLHFSVVSAAKLRTDIYPVGTRRLLQSIIPKTAFNGQWGGGKHKTTLILAVNCYRPIVTSLCSSTYTLGMFYEDYQTCSSFNCISRLPETSRKTEWWSVNLRIVNILKCH